MSLLLFGWRVSSNCNFRFDELGLACEGRFSCSVSFSGVRLGPGSAAAFDVRSDSVSLLQSLVAREDEVRGRDGVPDSVSDVC